MIDVKDMAKISKTTIKNIKEFMNMGCDYAGTQEFVDDLVTKTWVMLLWKVK